MSDCPCKPGYYEKSPSNSICGKCDNTKCATCLTNSTDCNVPCNPGCISCDITGACLANVTCNPGKYYDSHSA